MTIGDLPMPIHLENRGLLICGSIGTGKSVAIETMIASAIRRRDKLVITDPDGTLAVEVLLPGRHRVESLRSALGRLDDLQRGSLAARLRPHRQVGHPAGPGGRGRTVVRVRPQHPGRYHAQARRAEQPECEHDGRYAHPRRRQSDSRLSGEHRFHGLFPRQRRAGDRQRAVPDDQVRAPTALHEPRRVFLVPVGA